MGVIDSRVVNVDEVALERFEQGGRFASDGARLGPLVGAKDLGCSYDVVPPGKCACPFHSHRAEEEMFLILEGEGELRFGDRRYPLRRHDVIACPTGGPEVAHQIINTGKVDLRYLALSTLAEVEVCEYPDSDKVLLVTGKPGERGLRKMIRAEATVDYYDREEG